MSLHELQKKVHVTKDKRNDFGGYNYRTAEGILAAIKAELPEGAHINITDTLQEVAGQIFVTATAAVRFADGVEYSAQGHAMHPLTKKGMDPSQITGAASSYARKYALSGLMALDDGSVDPDAQKKPYEADNSAAAEYLSEADTLADLRAKWANLPKEVQRDPAVIKAKDDRKAALEKPQPVPADDLGGDHIPH